jgi:multiple sugar transport system substrate-binding protein
MPSYNGKITAKLHGDTFAIMEDSTNKEVAFKVLSAMVVAPELYQIYGGMPAVLADRPAFLASLDERSAPNTIDWSVAEEMLNYPDLPNHEAWTPNVAVVKNILDTFRTTMDQTPDLNLDEAIAQLKADLETALKEAPAP